MPSHASVRYGHQEYHKRRNLTKHIEYISNSAENYCFQLASCKYLAIRAEAIQVEFILPLSSLVVSFH
jgi:hypothetical protein